MCIRQDESNQARFSLQLERRLVIDWLIYSFYLVGHLNESIDV